jgi:hypothetical protein
MSRNKYSYEMNIFIMHISLIHEIISLHNCMLGPVLVCTTFYSDRSEFVEDNMVQQPIGKKILCRYKKLSYRAVGIHGAKQA